MKKTYLLIIVLLTCFAAISSAQSIVISGMVTEKDSHDPVIGATVKVKGGTLATATNASGIYKLTVPGNGPVTLVFSSISYTTIERTVTASATLNIELENANNV